MIDSPLTATGAVVAECPAGTSQPVVEGDAGREAQEPLQDALAQAGHGARPVALQCEQVLGSPEDGLDALADGREVWATAGRLPLGRGRAGREEGWGRPGG